MGLLKRGDGRVELYRHEKTNQLCGTNMYSTIR